MLLAIVYRLALGSSVWSVKMCDDKLSLLKRKSSDTKLPCETSGGKKNANGNMQSCNIRRQSCIARKSAEERHVCEHGNQQVASIEDNKSCCVTELNEGIRKTSDSLRMPSTLHYRPVNCVACANGNAFGLTSSTASFGNSVQSNLSSNGKRRSSLTESSSSRNKWKFARSILRANSAPTFKDASGRFFVCWHFSSFVTSL